jgi:HlyD family secretion protein
MKKKFIILSVIAAVIIAAGLFFFLKGRGNNMAYKAEKISRGEIKSIVTATGTVNAVTTVSVGTQVSGTIQKLYVDFNSPVKKGQQLAQIDPATFQAQVDQARANLFSAQATVEKAAVAVLDAQRTYQRSKELFARNFISQSDLDAAETNLHSAEAQQKVTRAQAGQAQASLKIAEANLEYARILSPVDGVVISRNVDVGQTVAASFQTPTLFSIAQDLTKMQINTSVDEADIGMVHAGQEASFTVDAYPDTPFTGKVSVVRNAPITVSNVVTYDVIINVENVQLKLKPGMTANVSITIETRSNALRIPNAAMRFKPADTPQENFLHKQGKNELTVWILEKEKPQAVRIITGIGDGSHTEVVSGELKEGQQIITESLGVKKTGSSSSAGRRPPGPGFM